MKKYCSSLTFGGLGIAFLTLALGLVSCHPEKTEKKTADGNDVIPTENLLWEETKSTTEGCKISATYPTDTTTALTRNIREWINEELGGTYAGDLNEGPKMIEYYGKAHADQIKRDIAEWGENTSMDKCAYYVQFKNVFESKQFVTYTSDVYEYAGGAHGSEYQGGAVFRKADGRKFGWDMFTADGKEKLRTLIEENLKKNYFKAANDSDFHAMLLLENADDPFPLPQTAPLFMPRGVQFIYQQYEIAPYAAGLPTCTLPYDKLKDLFTVTVKPLVESTTDSLAMSTYSRIDQSQKILPQSK